MGGSSGVILQAPSTNMSADVTFTLPDADGTAGQFIKTDGSTNLSFASASGGSGSALHVLASTFRPGSTVLPQPLLLWQQQLWLGNQFTQHPADRHHISQ